MRRAAILLAVLLMGPLPARADFFDDLGFALGKLGDSISEGVDDALGPSDSEKSGAAPENPSPQTPAPAAPPAVINWNPAPAGVITRDMARSMMPPLPRPRPDRSAAPYQLQPQMTADDAPPPRRAPARQPVQLLASLAPLPGYSDAPVLMTARPDYSPARAAAAMPIPTAAPAPPPPPAKPAAAVNRSFELRFGTRYASVLDTAIRTSPAPAAETLSLINAVAQTLKQPGMRVRLQSRSLAPDNRLAEARRRSFERAQLVSSWLVDAGIRSTQIDLQVMGAGDEDRVLLTVYRTE